MTSGYLGDRRGAVALEFALWLGLLTVPLLNAIDLGFYAFQAIQVREAADVAAQAAEVLCSPLDVPAATKCTNLSTQLTSAAQSTSLGTHVTVSTATSKSWEGYYCANKTGGLTVVSGDTWNLSTGTPPSSVPSCSGTVTGNSNNASDYIVVNVTYSFKPLFGAVSVAGLLGSTISQTAWMRLG